MPEKVKSMPRYGSLSSGALIVGNNEAKQKRSLTRFGGSSASNILSTSLTVPGKHRRKSDTGQKKVLQLRGTKENDFTLHCIFYE